MVIKIEAWKDSKGNLHITKEKAERADLFVEIWETFNRTCCSSNSIGVFLTFILDNYNLTRKVKK